MKKSVIAALVVALLVTVGASGAFAASITLNLDAFNYDAAVSKDVLGPNNTQKADGKTDAAFSLSVSGAQAIKEISVKQKETGAAWSSNPSGSTELLLVENSSGQVLNSSNRLPIVPVLIGANFMLYINDADKILAKDSTFTVDVKLIDNKVVSRSVNVKAKPVVTKPGEKPADTKKPSEGTKDSKDGIVSAEFVPASGADIVGTRETVGANGKDDARVTLKVNLKEATIAGIKVTAVAGGSKATWDTVKANNVPIVAVVDKNENILNKTTGEVSIPVKGEVTFSLFFQSEGIVEKSDVKIKVLISLADGRVFEKDAVKGKVELAKNSMQVEYKGEGNFDFVGTGEKLGSNLNPDKYIGVNINATGTIAGIKVKAKNGKVWDTIPDNKHWLLAVSNEKNERLNKADGSVSIPINGTETYYLWFEEESGADEPYRVTFVFTNGRTIEATAGKVSDAAAVTPPAPKPKEETPGSSVTKDDRDVTFLSFKPALVNVDIVGKNKKLGANGAKDMALKIRLVGKGVVTSITLKDPYSGGWDTLASNNGRWLLGVREGSKILNAKNGTVRFPVNGAKTYELLMQNNGKLTAKNGKFIVSVTWGDGQVSENMITW